MEQILPTNEIIEVEGKTYTNPQTGIDETNTFIDNLRATQGQQNQEIMTDTQMLGTDVPSVQGGLIGPESYFTSRYQTPFTNTTVADLRAVNQAKALNEVLANEKAIWKNRYQQAYRNYQKRARARARAAASGNSTTPSTPVKGTVEEKSNDMKVTAAVPGVSGGYTVAQFIPETGEVLGYTGVPYGEEYETNYNYRFNNGSQSSSSKPSSNGGKGR